MGTLMFQWRREIDKDHAENAIEIAKFESVRRDIERLLGCWSGDIEMTWRMMNK